MRKIRIPYFEMQEMMNFFSDIKKKYEYHRAGNSQLLYVNGVCYFSSTISEARRKNETMPDSDVYFVAKTKKYIERNKLVRKIKPNYTDRDSIKFFDYNKRVEAGDSFNDVYSVDIKKAYWVAALKEGWIDKKIYEEGLKVHKIARLASLGSFAKNIDIYKFDGREESFIKTLQAKSPHVFFNQANIIYKVMDRCRRECASVNGFLFYWTDGLYVKGEVAAKICEAIIDGAGFESETIKLIRIIRTKSAFVTVEVDPTSKLGEKNKEYPISIK